jgi:tight adherence protein C
MSDPLWLDLLLVLALFGVLWLLYRSPGVASQPAGAAADSGDAAWPLVSRFPAVARQAGYEPERLRWFLWWSKLTLALVLALGFFELWPGDGARLLGGLSCAVVGFLLPDLWLRLVRRRRQRRIQLALSYYLDLLVALLASGLGLEEAFRRAGRAGLPPAHPLAREVLRVSREIDAGRDRSEAFRALGERTGVPDLRALAAALSLVMRHGTPIETALESQADLLRAKQRENMRRKVAVSATKAIFPVFLCGFPVFLVIVLFPSILELWQVFQAFASLF